MCSVGVVHVVIAADEVEVDGEDAINRTAPIPAVGPHRVERTIAVEAAASHRQFQRRSKGTGAVILAPACAFCIQLGIRWQTITTRARVVYPIYTLP